MSYLKHMPIDNLKVDKSFIDDLIRDSKDEAIVKTIVDMGNHLKIAVVAEGIENEHQLRALMEHKCDVGQGYYFSRPLSPDQVAGLFRQNFLK